MKIKTLLVMPNKEVQIVKIPSSTKFIKSFIGNNLFRIKLSENIILIANKDASFDEFNRIVNGKHQSKILMYKDEYLEEYYTNQRAQKQKNAELIKKDIVNIAA